VELIDNIEGLLLRHGKMPFERKHPKPKEEAI